MAAGIGGCGSGEGVASVLVNTFLSGAGVREAFSGSVAGE